MSVTAGSGLNLKRYQPNWVSLMSAGRERKINLAKANWQSLILMVMLIPVYGLPYWLIWPGQLTPGQFRIFVESLSMTTLVTGPLLVFLVIAVGIVVHELLHGLTWAYYAKRGWQAIRFGVFWQILTPYAHCTEAVPVRHYLKAVLMPGIVLGLIPAIIAMVMGSLSLLLFSWLFTVAALGDFLMARMLWQENPDALAADMRNEAGFWIYER